MLQRTLDLLDEAQIPVRQVAEGADVGEKWLGRVARRELRDPGSEKIERVYRYLQSQKRAGWPSRRAAEQRAQLRRLRRQVDALNRRLAESP